MMGSVHLCGLPRGLLGANAVRLAAALLAVTALAPLPAAAQQRQTTTLMRTEIVDSASLRNAGDMDFGDIVPTVSGGTVVISPSATPTCTTTGGLVRSGFCLAPVFNGNAFYQADLRVMRPNGNKITLTGPGGATMEVNSFTFNSTGTTVYLGTNGANSRFRVEAADGTFTFYVGATLQVGPNQAPGIYSGTFDIRFTYN